ncbi:hypothetical protein QQF64_006087 [Cirrhinus molitorella]|uniref:Uncharacterized protein n=1 Tax=Cirrhinus molitorella TaxID=172907 RepID=A0ABR3ME32_9TELE
MTSVLLSHQDLFLCVCVLCTSVKQAGCSQAVEAGCWMNAAKSNPHHWRKRYPHCTGKHSPLRFLTEGERWGEKRERQKDMHKIDTLTDDKTRQVFSENNDSLEKPSPGPAREKR